MASTTAPIAVITKFMLLLLQRIHKVNMGTYVGVIGMVPKNIVKRLEETQIRERIKVIQILVVLKTLEMLWRVWEVCLLSLDPRNKTYSMIEGLETISMFPVKKNLKIRGRIVESDFNC